MYLIGINVKQYYSPAKLESDQKDLIISQLKAENYELHTSEKDYQDLVQHVK